MKDWKFPEDRKIIYCAGKHKPDMNIGIYATIIKSDFKIIYSDTGLKTNVYNSLEPELLAIKAGLELGLEKGINDKKVVLIEYDTNALKAICPIKYRNIDWKKDSSTKKNFDLNELGLSDLIYHIQRLTNLYPLFEVFYGTSTISDCHDLAEEYLKKFKQQL